VKEEVKFFKSRRKTLLKTICQTSAISLVKCLEQKKKVFLAFFDSTLKFCRLKRKKEGQKERTALEKVTYRITVI
jgi:hypothetical protein